ncbi:nuclear transport factor 2 family protein [Aquimarina gracilis]|uniref:Nuclear transport factor 2 family protein n=1 Tax=Aquimarina gracilis TaxID=874422 RepID=A0ABU5ZWC4_9FLAO|nr:nuclear transport factor 2 family protein [Aquimarina gracilis]MEB3346179.1 nuclear transport factor 2 family protein [Aquimarina gracilis]
MKKYHYIKSIIIITILLVSQFVNSQEEKKDVLETIEEFNTAFKEGNVDKLSSMITKDYIHTNSNAKPIDKETWLAYLKKRKEEIDTQKLEVHSYEMNETKIQQYDNMVIVSAKITTSSTKNGILTTNEYRVTNIWVLEDGAWKRAGFHDGKIK